MSYRCANLQRCILYIYSTNIRTGYLKHAAHSPFFFLSSKCRLFHNATFFGSCVIHILHTGCAKIKKKIRHLRVTRRESQDGRKYSRGSYQVPPSRNPKSCRYSKKGNEGNISFDDRAGWAPL